MKNFKKTLCVFISVLMAIMTTAPIFSAFNYASANEDSIVWGGHTYKRFDESMTWKEAKSYCEALGGYLATVTSYAEQTALMRLIKGGEKAQYWLGATDEAKEGTWEWVTGEKWSYKFPNYGFDNAYGVEDYLQIMRHNWGNGNALGYWNDSANDNTIKGEEEFFSLENVGFICEFGEQLDCSGDTPIVYIIGRTGIYTADGEPTISENTEFITDVIEQCGPELKDAILKGKWDAFSDKVYELISARYEKYRISNDGEVVDGSHNLWTWNKETLPSRMGDIFTYRFEYDARRDPCAIADDLHEYITAIKEKTGYDKIHLISRCLGCNIASAYLAEYGWEDILTNVFFASAAKGYDFVGEMFAGKFGFKSGAIARYEDDTFDDEDAITNELVKAALAFADKSGLLPIGTGIGTLVYKSVSEKIVPRLIVSTYATCPGYWAMVNDENYEDAKKFLFGDEVNTTYKKLIEKTDNYHYNVQRKLEENLKAMKNDGCKINVICKYGFQMPPFIESSEALSDNRIEVVEQSFGATTTEVDKTFSLIYMNKAKKNGTAKYISPDKKIDSSTALFPDNTWYIKNIVHNPFYDCFNLLMLEMCYGDEQMTVESDPIWPQYLFYDNTTSNCIPLTEENMGSDSYYTTNYFKAFFRFAKALIAYIKMSLSK